MFANKSTPLRSRVTIEVLSSDLGLLGAKNWTLVSFWKLQGKSWPAGRPDSVPDTPIFLLISEKRRKQNGRSLIHPDNSLFRGLNSLFRQNNSLFLLVGNLAK